MLGVSLCPELRPTIVAPSNRREEQEEEGEEEDAWARSSSIRATLIINIFLHDSSGSRLAGAVGGRILLCLTSILDGSVHAGRRWAR